ncbi:putative protein serine/threonine kinase [Quaeritorhiza haematococci]|nr:putative protein serine/threonine kinase [Quaeritorhiza haematococci]
MVDQKRLQVDIWSLGIMSIELATGRPPRGELHPMDILYQIPTCPSPQLQGNYTDAFKEFINKCLAKAPSKRASAQELLQHPFMAKERDKSLVKGVLEQMRLKKNDATKTEHKKLGSDDWWSQYNKATQAKKEAASAVPSKPLPSAAAKATIRPDLAHLNPTETYGKKRTMIIKKTVMMPSAAPPAEGNAPSNAPNRQQGRPMSTAPGVVRAASAAPGNRMPAVPTSAPQTKALNSSQSPARPPPPAPQVQSQKSTSSLVTNAAAPSRPASAGPHANPQPPNQNKHVPSQPKTGATPSGTPITLTPASSRPASATPSKPGPRPTTGTAVQQQALSSNVQKAQSSSQLVAHSESKPPTAFQKQTSANLVKPAQANMTSAGPIRPSSATPGPKLNVSKSTEELKSSSTELSESSQTKPALRSRVTISGAPTSAGAKPEGIPKSESAPNRLSEVLPDLGKANNAALNKEFSEIMSPSLSAKTRAEKMALFRCVEDLYFTEMKHVEMLQSIMEVYVRPLMTAAASKSQVVLKEDQIKAIFANVTALHSFANDFVLSIKEAVESLTDRNVEVQIAKTLEAVLDPMEQVYEIYTGGLCSSLWELHRCLRDLGKFRDFVSRQQSESGSLHKLLTRPVVRISEYAQAYKDIASTFRGPTFKPTLEQMQTINADMSGAIGNCEQLIHMLLNIADVPPAMILKRKQRLLFTDTVDKLHVTSNNTIRKRKPMRLYLLNDAILTAKVLREQSTEPFELDSLFDLSKSWKAPKPQLQYRTIFVLDFVDVASIEDINELKNAFSITLAIKKGKTTYYAASSAEMKALLVELMKFDGDSETTEE